MELILMRHGKAEEGHAQLADKDRCLTDQGRKRAIDAAAVLHKRLVGKGPLHIWSSPLRRAKETAEIVAAASGIRVREVVEIAQGDLMALATLWQDFSEKDTLLVVGHEPDIGLWSARLANVVLPFRPGSAAAFQVDDKTVPFGRLLWFMQAGLWGKLT